MKPIHYISLTPQELEPPAPRQPTRLYWAILIGWSVWVTWHVLVWWWKG